MRQFVAVIFKDPDGGLDVTFPALPEYVAYVATIARSQADAALLTPHHPSLEQTGN